MPLRTEDADRGCEWSVIRPCETSRPLEWGLLVDGQVFETPDNFSI